MTFRSLLMLGLGAVLVLGPSSVASAQVARDETNIAATSAQAPKKKDAAAKKNSQKPKKTSKAGDKSKEKTKASAKSGKDTPAAGDTAKPEKQNFFAAIFKPIPRVNQAAPTTQPQRNPTAKERREAERTRQEIANQPVHAVVATGNNGELRSELTKQQSGDLFSALFGGTPRQQLLPETRALDAALAAKEARRQFKVKSDFEPQQVAFSGYQRGTIVIDTSARYLYLVESSSTARRYAIAVGREGLEFKGRATVGDKQEWPRWIPTLDMQKREPKKYGQYKDGMPGGPDNPLGARAIYLYQGKKDTHIRIHGTNQPQTIGTNASNGCFRMVNEHVKDLYSRVRMGTEVVVM